ncbi:hypothetical protein H8Q54_004662 [Vibrio parahaemolyticus]|nr:hypothetical protein [Vibrio parahaemolyticus]
MNQKTYNKFPKGSQWRKWDLHLHTPYTNLNPYTATDEQFISKLKAEEISAVALTNYYFFKDEEFTLKSKLESEGITTFLNLELRSSYTNTDEKCCDIHVIFSDDVSKEEIQNLLVKLSLNVGAAKKMALGLKSQDLQSATVDFWHLHEILNDEALGLQGRFFIGFLSRGHGNARSSSNFETVYAKSDFLLHSTDKGSNLEEDREFWLKNRRPLFQSSDAHSLEKIGTKFSWIKSAPTFEGLKQVVYEPEERICLQVTKPDQKPTYQVIDSLDLSNSGLWEGKIELNENLNTIIGGRSTGKSSLLASIAYKLGKFSTDNERYHNYISSIASSVKVNWKDGNDDVDRDVDYFPQSFMYTLASDDTKRNKLISGIIKKKDENAILDRYSEFVASQKSKQETLISSLFATKDAITKKEEELSTLGDKVVVEAEIRKLEGELAALSGDFSVDEKAEYEQVQVELRSINEKLTRLDKLSTELTELTKQNFFKDTDIEDKISEPNLGKLFSDKYNQLKMDFEKSWIAFVAEREVALSNRVKDLTLQKEQNETKPIYVKGQELLLNDIAAQHLSNSLNVERKKLIEIEQKEEELSKLNKAQASLSEQLAESHEEYKEQSNKLSEQLKFSGGDLEVTVTCSFDNEIISNILSEQLIQRSNDQKQLVTDFCNQYPEDPKETVRSLISIAMSNKLQCKGSHTPQSTLTQVLSTNTYKQDYELTYQNDSFENMSQGKQAFVVLKLLLEFSDKICPVLIDQPEDSLDNRAIYNELVKYLKLKKKDRQIILVTHNPNVVVSADAEQVIVANQNDVKLQNKSGMKFQYVSGGIEHTKPKDTKCDVFLYSQGIREHICEVLEGGNEAFRKREQKYQLKM